MLTLSIPTQNHFGSPTLSPTGSPTAVSRPPLLQPALRPPTLMNPAAPRRSMMPQLPTCNSSSKRPKLSLQTAILPQPVSPALPLPCSADTPTSRNTLANSFRSPGPEKQTFERAEVQPQGSSKENAQLPYGVESVKNGILKNTPLANLIRSRKQEKRRNGGVRIGIKFVEEPQLIPRPPQDSETDVDEEVEEVSASISANSASENGAANPVSITSAGETAQSSRLKSNDSTEWRRLRTQRSANEGRELRRSSASTPIASAPSSTSSNKSSAVSGGIAPSSPAPSDSGSESSDYLPPQTPETPSPAQTRDWVWTLGNDFNSRSHGANRNNWAPYTPPDSSDSSRRSSAATGEDGPGALPLPISMPMPSRNQLSAAIKTPPVIGGRLPDTPVSATEKPGSPGSVPLPETPAPGMK